VRRVAHLIRTLEEIRSANKFVCRLFIDIGELPAASDRLAELIAAVATQSDRAERQRWCWHSDQCTTRSSFLFQA
jgi:hypothetical protein